MAYTFQTINNKLLPGYRQYNDDTDVISYFTWQAPGTGLAGSLVSMVSFNPDDTNGYNLDAPMGSQPPGTLSPRYQVNNRMRLAASGDTKWTTLGITLRDHRDTDENDLPYRYFPDKAESQFVSVSGQSAPVLVRGVLALKLDAIVGLPVPGYVGVIHSGGGGKIESVNPTMLNETGDSTAKYNQKHVVGKFLSSTGSSFGGYAVFKLEL